MKAATGSSGAFFEIERISIHAAREGGDFAYERKAKISFISIHAAREGGDSILGAEYAQITISIHAAREGGDPSIFLSASQFCVFQSTPPVKAATRICYTIVTVRDFNPRRP